MAKCPDCGCTLQNGVCSNCQEELFIIQNQSEFIKQPLSKEFTDKAKDQQEYLRRRSAA